MDELDLGATIRGFGAGQKLFGRYTLLRQLGRGGMGVVWRARDDSLERDVAIKMLPEMVANDPASVRELKRETSRNQQLSHPHILRVYDFAEGAGLCGITMEIAEGGTLTSRRLDQPGEVFEPAQLGPWLRQLCEALDYAHQRGKVVHRDLKPANLMLTADDELKVTDFGIAASLSESVTRVSKQAGSSGTPVYMSPQQMMGDKPAVTDDIYALGATLYELLTGKPPFYAGNVLLQVQSKRPPSLAERRTELGVAGAAIPAEWEQVISACLAKEPKERPQSAGEVAERLGLTMDRGRRSEDRGQKPEDKQGARRPDEPRKTDVPSVAVNKRKPATFMPMVIAAVFGLGSLGWYFGMYAPEQKRRAEQERAAAAEKENQDRQNKAAAEAKAKAEEEKKIYTGIAAKIDAFVDGSPSTLRASTDAAVKAYLAGAPTRFRTEIETRWKDRQAGWEAALEMEKQRLAADRLANARGGIVVRTNPPGAEVRIGAIALDKSPLTLKDQRLGRYPVRVRLDGYEEWTGEVEVKENEFADLNVTLVRSTGKVVLTGTPGAEVTSDNTRLGVLPLSLDQVPTGPVRYKITLMGHKPAEVMGEVTRNTELRLGATLEIQAYPLSGLPWENGLGQKFVPVPGINVLFSIWETRVQDFEAFVRETGYDATAGARTTNAALIKGQYGGSWRSPGFPQTGLHPVSCMSHADAEAFCRWLTERERREGRLAPDQEYRLPTDAEWDAAAGGDRYPWGKQWPPPVRAGNYADSAAKRLWPGLTIIDGYDDGHAGTAPVGSFTPNRFGIYDIGGNLWERVDDQQHGLRGGSFIDNVNYALALSYRGRDPLRIDYIGFRVVCAVAGASSSNTAINASPSGANKPVVGQKWTIPDLQLDLMPIAPGTFQMGSVSGGNRDERPVTLVTLTKPFWLGKTEVTQAQWVAVMGSNPAYLQSGTGGPATQKIATAVLGRNFKGGNLPVESVSWNDAMEFCQKLTERERAAGRLPEGLAYTLPTEAQWEYACRAGTTGDYAGNLDALGWYNGNANGSTKPVGTKQANAWGLHDMHGNVYEWCLDWYGNYPGESVTDPTGPPSGTSRVGRGGSLGNAAGSCRSAVRSWFGPDNRVNFLGFRLALVAVPAQQQTGSAKVFIYRPGRASGSLVKVSVEMGGKVIAVVPNKRFVEVDLPAGAQMLSGSWKALGLNLTASLKTELTTGRVYYVRVLVTGELSMAAVDEATAKAEMADLKRSTPD